MDVFFLAVVLLRGTELELELYSDEIGTHLGMHLGYISQVIL